MTYTSSQTEIFDKERKGIPFTPKNNDAQYKFLPTCDLFFDQIAIEPRAYAKMLEYTRQCDLEISWLGIVYEEEKKLVIEDTFLFEQEVSGTTTELDEHAMAKFGLQLIEFEAGEEGRRHKFDAADIISRMRVWGHSHVNMQTNPSGQDDSTMMSFHNSIRNTDYPYMVRIITNKRGELRLDVYYYDYGLAQLDFPWQLNYKHEVDPVDIINEMRTKVKKRSFNYQYSGGGQQANKGWQPQGVNNQNNQAVVPVPEKTAAEKAADEFDYACGVYG